MCWEAGKQQWALETHIDESHCSPAKVPMNVGTAYLAINPATVWDLWEWWPSVWVFLHCSARWEECALWRCCPSCFPLASVDVEVWQRCLCYGAGTGQLQLSIACDLGCQGDGFQKAKSTFSFQRLGCFFWSADQGEKHIQDCWLFCSVLFCFCTTTWMLLATEWELRVSLDTESSCISCYQIIEVFLKKTASKYWACEYLW